MEWIERGRGDSRFLEQEWAQLCRESVRIAIFRKRSLGSRSSKNRVFATGWVFSGQRYLLRIAGNFTSLESSRGTRSHAIVVARKLPRFIFTILSKFLFCEKSPRLVYQTFKYLHPFFFVFLVIFFQMHHSEGNQKIFLSLSRTNIIIPVDFYSFGGIFGSISPPIIRSSRRENAHQREG